MQDLNLRAAYDFELPESQIATHPRVPRDNARLLVLDANGQIKHHIFRDVIDLFAPGDCIVVNDVEVQRARFFVQRKTGALIEVLLTDDATAPTRRHSCLFRASKLTPNEELTAVGDGSVRVRLSRGAQRQDPCYVEFLGDEPVLELLERIGQLPLPPYIVSRRKTIGAATYEASDLNDYQTVYANGGSAVAAPTAGLHFTDDLIAALRAKGVSFERLRLDVGTGTFRPIQCVRLDDHKMHSETYVITDETAKAIMNTKAKGGKIIAVGTTVVRSLEAQFQHFGRVCPGSYETDIFIKPGHKFGIVDQMITNFHLPGSTLMVLVSAFAGYDPIMAAYAEAIRDGYLFYSYGDAMLLSR